MLKYETIERLPESLFYTRINNKPYKINVKAIDSIDNKVKPSDTKYVNSYLLFKPVNVLPSTNIVNTNRKNKTIIFSNLINKSETIIPEMNNDINGLVYKFSKDSSTIFSSKSIFVRNPEYVVNKDDELFNNNNSTLIFNMGKDVSDRNITVNKPNTDRKKKSYINIGLSKDDNSNGYLDPMVGSILNKSDSLSYGDLTYVMGSENIYNSLQNVKHNVKLISSIVKIPITRNLEIKHEKKSIFVYIEEFGLGNDNGGIGNLEITLEVYKLTEMRFKLPSGYLTGLNTNPIAYAEGDVLVVFTRELGEVILYTDKGSITIRTLPGMKINKRRIVGDEADIFA